MPLSDYTPEDFLGLEVDGYKLSKHVGKGKIGFVYKAINIDGDVFACKVIPERQLKDGWFKEVSKVRKLDALPNIIQYKNHGVGQGRDKRPFTWIFWNFVDGDNLREYIEKNPGQLSMPLIHEIGSILLNVLFACKAVGIHHGDLHPGNILISKPDNRFRHRKSQIFIADFGMGSSLGKLQPKDDRAEICTILHELLDKMHPDSLIAEHKVERENMRLFVRKRLAEHDPTQGNTETDLGKLIDQFEALPNEAQAELEAQRKLINKGDPGDFPVAENMGDDRDKWADLFVPKFLGIEELLKQSITVLTGARGCGKTMAFKRLSAYMDKVLGGKPEFENKVDFVGFYLQARSIQEAFPHLPSHISATMKARYLHFFHLMWLAEICKTISLYDPEHLQSYSWLENWISNFFPSRYNSLPEGSDILENIRSFVDNEKEYTRSHNSKREEAPEHWPLSRIDFLDSLSNLMQENLSWVRGSVIYFFLDDYTIPIITRQEQRLLNPVIFRRTANYFFKISTEAINSIDLYSTRGKPLELNHDYSVVDLASESLHADDNTKLDILNRIFNKRIPRNKKLAELNLTLENILGSWKYNNNSLALAMRKKVENVRYHGIDVFIRIWNSDTRNMIQLFTDMLRDGINDIKDKETAVINPEIQNRHFRQIGKEFLESILSAPDPKFLEKHPRVEKNAIYGEHLKNIVEAFIKVSKFELMEADLVKNEEHFHPKQAFRIEIIDQFQLSDKSISFYEGLIRWHIFLQDRRGKSIRNNISPRMFLNRMLIPYATITFSKHDHIHLNNQQFNLLLTEPQNFFEHYKKKRIESMKKKQVGKSQMGFDFTKSRGK